MPAGHDGHPMDVIPAGGNFDYHYPNDQDAASLWYHDHAHGRTSRTLYHGLMAMYLLEDAMRDGSTTLTVKHEGTAVELITGERRSMPVTTIVPITPEPTQPAGRRPMPVEEIEDAGTG